MDVTIRGISKHQKWVRCPYVSFLSLRVFLSQKKPKNGDLKTGSDKVFLVYKLTVKKLRKEMLQTLSEFWTDLDNQEKNRLL